MEFVALERGELLYELKIRGIPVNDALTLDDLCDRLEGVFNEVSPRAEESCDYSSELGIVRKHGRVRVPYLWS